MKIQTIKENLLTNIQIVQNIVTPRVSLPILSNMLLEAEGGVLKLTTTDLDIGISCGFPVEVVETGAITIPTKRFADIIRELPEGYVNIDVKKNNMVCIQTETCEFKIMGLPKEEFPRLPEFKDKEIIKIEQAVLKEMLLKTSFAVSHDETRYVLNGVLFKIENERITLIATDGRRLALIEKKLNMGINKPVSMIVPSKTISELNRDLKDQGNIAIILGNNQVLFDLGLVIIVSRLIEGEFPDYRKVLQEEKKDKIKISRESLLAALKRAALLATQDYQAVKIEVFKNKLVVSKSTPDIGESREDLETEYSGKELIAGFNPVYLIEVLKNLEDESVNFEIADPEKPGVIRREGYIYIVLPMRL